MILKGLPRARTWTRAFSAWRAARRGRARPLFVSWFMTRRCNLACRACFYYAQGRPEAPDLPSWRCREIVREMADAGVVFLEMVGGEPLLRHDALDLGALARDLGLSVHLTTNGLPLRKGDGRLLDRVFDSVFVSLDGFRAENDAVRGQGSWARAVAGLDVCLAECRRSLVGVATVVNEVNLGSLPAWASWLRGRGVPKLALFHGFAPWGRVEPAMARKVLGDLARLQAEEPAFLVEEGPHLDRLRDHYEGSGAPACDAGRLLQIAIFHDGEVSACCKWPAPIGHVASASLSEVLDGAERAGDGALRERLAACPGCVRHDSSLVSDLLARPLPSALWRVGARAIGGRLPL